MNNRDFTEVLYDLCAPDLFNIALTKDEKGTIYEQIVKDSKQTGFFPSNYLQWRDAAYDAMEELGYELAC